MASSLTEIMSAEENIGCSDFLSLKMVDSMYNAGTSLRFQDNMRNLNLWSDADMQNLIDSTSASTKAPNVERDLLPFVWDTNHHEPSRTLAVMNASSVPLNEIVSICDSFGVTNIRSEYLDVLGVCFIAFSDIRCAQFAAMQLPSRLQRFMGGGEKLRVNYCTPLNSSFMNDESLVVILGLPHHIAADSLRGVMSQIGAIRSLKYVAGYFVAEFQNVQDARKAVDELESTQPWGPEVVIEKGARENEQRKKERQLVAMLLRWSNDPRVRQSQSSNMGHHGTYMNRRGNPPYGDSLAGNARVGQNHHLVLDLQAMENGYDPRTSLMVRNIPNEYTQAMLLEELTENNFGLSIIDFFYLPIDFKTRRNRGYAFINFVDHRDILNFYRQYYGRRWRKFNSDAICDITYARIQGKTTMLKRFENSALMEMNEECRPLVFVSSGPDRGTEILQWPDTKRRRSASISSRHHGSQTDDHLLCRYIYDFYKEFDRISKSTHVPHRLRRKSPSR